ncbi:hypothetical protein LWI29_019008 [Acer saccharum]|uniref:RING-type E3 ubiquitin transferase n=1 Tax=Acer saccharum TaxID=4024 RepID=A0AA39RXD0_ACESA|nr:hypothetical protein LWI29_019008 [Acer saccharum]
MEEEDTVYVAVGKDVNESKLTLSWALRNFGGDNFCILPVHQLPQTIASYSFNFLFLLCVGLDLKNMNPAIYLIARLCEKSRKVRLYLINMKPRKLCNVKGKICKRFWTITFSFVTNDSGQLHSQLAHMALRCCDIEPSKRPDLVSEAWRVLKPMRATCGASSSFWTGSRDHSKPPIIFHLPYLTRSDARSSCGSRWLYI